MIILAGLLLFVPLFAVAQNKKIDMNGPAPRLPNGKPSMAGVWGQVRRADVTDKRLPGYVAELPYTDWGRKQWESYDARKGDYTGTCLPFECRVRFTVRGPFS